MSNEVDTSVESLGISIDETAENMLELYGTYGSNAETIIQNMEQGAAQARPEAVAGIQAATPSPAVLNDDVVNELMSDWDVVVGGAQKEALAIQRSVADRIESANNATQNYLQGLSAALPLLETRLQAQVDAAAKEASRRYGGGGGGGEDDEKTREDYLNEMLARDPALRAMYPSLLEMGAGTYALSEGAGLPQYITNPMTGQTFENPAWINLSKEEQEEQAAQEAAESLEAEKASLMSMWGLDFDSPFYVEDGVPADVVTPDIQGIAYQQIDEIFGTDFSDPDGSGLAAMAGASYITADGKNIRKEALNTFMDLLTVATPAYAYHAAVHTYDEMLTDIYENQPELQWDTEFEKQDDYFVASLGVSLVAYQMATGQPINWDVLGDPKGGNVFNLETENGEPFFPSVQPPDHPGGSGWLEYWETKNPALKFPDPTEMARHFDSLPSPTSATSGTSGPIGDPLLSRVTRTPQHDWDSFVTDTQPSMISDPVQYGPEGYTVGDPILDAARGGMDYPTHFGWADTDPYPHSPNPDNFAYHVADTTGNIGNYIIDNTLQPWLNKPAEAITEARGDKPGEAIRGFLSHLNPKPHIDNAASNLWGFLQGPELDSWGPPPSPDELAEYDLFASRKHLYEMAETPNEWYQDNFLDYRN